jgi:hypothetical protein
MLAAAPTLEPGLEMAPEPALVFAPVSAQAPAVVPPLGQTLRRIPET